jgi:hypothetical protein
LLLKHETLRGIAEGRITLAFRRWKRPTVRAGGTLLTSIGQLAIEGVDAVTLRDLTESDAVAAGFADVGELTAALSGRQEGTPYRVRLRLAGPDPRIALRAALPAADELRGMLDRLDRWDSSSTTGPWTRSAMGVIARRPGVRAGDLAAEIDMERARFKSHVRKLKGFGLTESLEVGYRLSPRGEAVFAASEGDGTEHRSTSNR